MDIPVDAHLVTLTVETQETVTRQVQVGRATQTRHERVTRTRDVPTTRDEANVRTALAGASRIFASAGIGFQLRSTRSERVAAPGNAEVVDRNGFLFLARQFPARNGVSLLLVSRFSSADLGGEAVEAQCVCVVNDTSPVTTLAHELGHLLHLDHEGDIRNLMNPGLSVPDPALTPAQVRTAQQSTLARRFAGSGG